MAAVSVTPSPKSHKYVYGEVPPEGFAVKATVRGLGPVRGVPVGAAARLVDSTLYCHTPRPWEPDWRSPCWEEIVSSHWAVRGRPVPRADHVLPPSGL